MLSDDLKKLQMRRDFYYKISHQFLDKMSNGTMNLIDYFNMVQIKKEIDMNVDECKLIVREIWGNQNERFN